MWLTARFRQATPETPSIAEAGSENSTPILFLESKAVIDEMQSFEAERP